MITCIANGLVCFEDRIQRADVLVQDERIAGVAGPGTAYAENVVDAEGGFILPGLIDVHTHIDDRIGRYALADDYASGTRVAVENGVTTVATFVTESEEIPLERALANAVEKATGNCYSDHWWHLTPTRFDDDGWKAINRLIGRGFHSFKFYTTYRNAGLFSSYDQLEWIFERLAGHNLRFLIHCEDDEILGAVHLPDEEWRNPAAHARSRPPQSEILAVREVLRRAERQQAAVHIVHVSTPGALELIQDARNSVRVTCETCPQYLFLDDSWLQRDQGHRWVCSPPLRSAAMRHAMSALSADGAVDLFATDHCAFRKQDKDTFRGSVRDVPNGIAGIGALPHLVYALLAERSPDPMQEMARRLSANPARLLGVYPRKGTIRPGSDADLVLCRTGTPEHPIRSSLADVHETYPGQSSKLHIRSVMVRGHWAVRQGRLVDPDERRGKPLWPI